MYKIYTICYIHWHPIFAHVEAPKTNATMPTCDAWPVNQLSMFPLGGLVSWEIASRWSQSHCSDTHAEHRLQPGSSDRHKWQEKHGFHVRNIMFDIMQFGSFISHCFFLSNTGIPSLSSFLVICLKTVFVWPGQDYYCLAFLSKNVGVLFSSAWGDFWNGGGFFYSRWIFLPQICYYKVVYLVSKYVMVQKHNIQNNFLRLCGTSYI